MTDSGSGTRTPEDPLARYEDELDPFSVNDPEARAREERRLEREARRAKRQERGKRRRSLGSLVRGENTDGGRPEDTKPAAPPPAAEPSVEKPRVEAPAVAPPPDTEETAAAPPDAEAPYRYETGEQLYEAYRKPSGAEAAGAPPRRPATGAVWRRRIFALIVVALGAAAVWFGFALFEPFKGDGEGKVVVEVPKGATAGEIADLLEEKGVISNSSLFRIRLTLAGEGDDIVAGNYTLARDMSYGSAIDALSEEPGTTQTVVTVPEGYTLDQIADLASDSGLEGDYKKAASKPPKGFDPGKYGAGGAGSLEGFLFPATSELDPNSSSEDLVAQQVAAFEKSFKKVDMGYAESKGLDAYDVLTIASMIEREVQVPEERELVSAVIYNRLGSGEPLGIDATLRYALDNFDRPLTQSDLATDTPYNTRLVAGLPPTPIGNPGLAAIQAAAHPAKVDYTFYVVKPGTCGEHVFTASEAEFEKAAQEYQDALEAEGGSPTYCSAGGARVEAPRGHRATGRPFALARDAHGRPRGARHRRRVVVRGQRAVPGGVRPARAAAGGGGLRRRQRDRSPQARGAGPRGRGLRGRRRDRGGEHALVSRRAHPRRQHRRSGPAREPARAAGREECPRPRGRRRRAGGRLGASEERRGGRDLEPHAPPRGGARDGVRRARGAGRGPRSGERRTASGAFRHRRQRHFRRDGPFDCRK